MADSIRDVPGIRVGHCTDAAQATGCTVVLPADHGAVAGVDVRGDAPGTRETDLLRPTALVERINAVCLAGGSAFGLGAADGVMRRLAERGVGFATGVRPVPIVPAAILFDLGVGDATAFPDADAGYAATLAAEANDGPLEGAVGAGTGATVGKIGGVEGALQAGVGSAARAVPGGGVVGALVVNNALGNVIGRDGRALTHAVPSGRPPLASNTVLLLVATDLPLDRAQCQSVARLSHDALARALRPAHTAYDGDVAFVLSTGDGSRVDGGLLMLLGELALDAIHEAIERSVTLGAEA